MMSCERKTEFSKILLKCQTKYPGFSSKIHQLPEFQIFTRKKTSWIIAFQNLCFLDTISVLFVFHKLLIFKETGKNERHKGEKHFFHNCFLTTCGADIKNGNLLWADLLQSEDFRSQLWLFAGKKVEREKREISCCWSEEKFLQELWGNPWILRRLKIQVNEISMLTLLCLALNLTGSFHYK